MEQTKPNAVWAHFVRMFILPLIDGRFCDGDRVKFQAYWNLSQQQLIVPELFGRKRLLMNEEMETILRIEAALKLKIATKI